MSKLKERLKRADYLRYVLASGGALALDMGTFLVLLAVAVPSTGAAALGYAAGVVGHWLASSRLVFVDRLAPRGLGRMRQKSAFAVSALAGLGATVAIVWSCVRAGLDPRLAKLIAIGLSFQLTWLLRKHFVFRAPTRVS